MSAAALVVASCGGGDDARSALSGESDDAGQADPPATDSVTTDVPVTEPPVTEPAPTDPPATDPPSTEPATDAPPPTGPPGAPDPAYCGASSQFYLEAQALREIDDDAAAQQIFERMQVSLTATLINAPDEAAAATPRQMQEVFDVLLPALESVDFDADALDTLPNADELQTNFGTFVEIVERLEAFLVDGCGVDVEALQRQAVDLAAQVGSGSSSDSSTGGPDVDPPAGGVQTVTDDSGTITTDVPAEWTDVRGEPDGELRQVVAAPDVDAFLASYSEPGVIIASGDAPVGNGSEAADAALEAFRGAVEADGCSQNIAAPYDDGVYVGERLAYSCPGSPANVTLAAGTNSAGDIFWLFAIVTAEGDADTVSLITDSFFVD